MSLPSSVADFVPCDRLLQKAYCHFRSYLTRHKSRFSFSKISEVEVVLLLKNLDRKKICYQLEFGHPNA